MDLQNFNLVNSLLFPTPEPSYGHDDFPEELIWVPKSLDPQNAPPEDCIPCLLMSSPASRFFILYLHGNAEDLGRCHAFCSLIRYQFQVHVLAVEYPGYGVCPGQASEESVIDNASVAFDFLRKVLNWPLDGIMIFGRSIGCGPALHLAVQHNVYGVILVCPFLSVRELCREFVGRLADLIEERFANKDKIELVASPLLLVHGKKDSVVPWQHGKALFDACRSRKKLVAPESMHHNSNLISDASYLVLPMLQFFCLPDYDFNDVKVPEWAFHNRHLADRFCESAAAAAQDPEAGSQRNRSLGANGQISRCGGGGSPGKVSIFGPVPGVELARTTIDAPFAQLDDSSSEEGSTTSSEDVELTQRKAKGLRGRGKGTVRLASRWGPRKEVGDELPEPPEEQGYHKVPRSKVYGPRFEMPVVKGSPLPSENSCWSLNWWALCRRSESPSQPSGTTPLGAYI
mmetsp:Transcript_60702/g.141452  ORF Transcript_60702/g.141452 Transcript_60702/m.141452 type:complete len:458 (+) Transcript_60702:199-1572(+)|eukprot:CAMPEP_0171109834 /NCGR_PEP_ID=MMETSP0766_2-20121228/71004_1 /TAXON_ID=439317 /ORGANISM="Gambierdiscus australes, Strain CAWD 149" /LENGTH=457 /DNA_ID=CAMNT_0011571623 /DNA_START=114 /DNA_END=1487 /DNA_ORIENTATION=-